MRYDYCWARHVLVWRKHAYVEEWKTITLKSWTDQKGRCKAEWLNQGFLYSFVTNLNLTDKKTRIVSRIVVYVRGNNEEESIKEPVAVFTETLSWKELREKVEAYLEKLLGRKWIYLPFSRAVLTPHLKTWNGRPNVEKLGVEFFCNECKVNLSDRKKYLIADRYFCNMCFYTSATQTEFDSKKKEFLECPFLRGNSIRRKGEWKTSSLRRILSR